MNETPQDQKTPPPPKKRGIRVVSLNKLIPNVLTLMGLAAGLTSVRFALDGQWEFAAMAVAVAALLDALDGRVARLLKGASKFGAELDSLSDFVCFGVCPALMSRPPCAPPLLVPLVTRVPCARALQASAPVPQPILLLGCSMR